MTEVAAVGMVSVLVAATEVVVAKMVSVSVAMAAVVAKADRAMECK